jgi:L-seryl-tRNA(Ser) seleniumtransferase
MNASASTVAPTGRPPSVDALARSLAPSGLPHALCVDIARQAIADRDVAAAPARAEAFRRTLLTDVVNATGVLLHTNLGRAPVAFHAEARAVNVEFDLATGERGSRQRAVGQLLARMCGAEAAIIVNNNAAAVLLVCAALGHGRQVLVSRGESVEIGGSFRVPEVMEQSGAELVDVGTTNRTRLSDYRRALARKNADVAMVLKVHPSNYRVEGFVEETPVEQLATLGVPVVADIGSGLIDATCPWLPGAPPAWLAGEPAAVQSLAAGAALITFSGDKLLGGPQVGLIVGRREPIERIRRFPMKRALRVSKLPLAALEATLMLYLRPERLAQDLPTLRLLTRSQASIQAMALAVQPKMATTLAPRFNVEVVELLGQIGSGSLPIDRLPSAGLALSPVARKGIGRALDELARTLRGLPVPVIGRISQDRLLLDLRCLEDASALLDQLPALQIALG